MAKLSRVRNLLACYLARPIRKAPPGARLAVEALEDRWLPSRLFGAGLIDDGSIATSSRANSTGGTVVTGSSMSTLHVSASPHSAGAPLQLAGGNGPPISIPYNGGSLLTHVKVQGVYYNDPITLGLQSQLDGFFTNILQSPWLTQMLANFSVGNLTIGAGSFLSDDNTGLTAPQGDSVFDNTIPNQLSSELAKGRLAAPDGNTLYAVFLPPSSAFPPIFGYHGAFIDPGSGKVVYFMAVFPGPDPNFNEFQELTLATSHELSESITDPGVGRATPTHPRGDLGWATPQLEIGDVSEAADVVTYHGFVMQEEWGRSPTDPPLLALGPIVAPVDTDFAVTQVRNNPTEGSNNGVVAIFTDKDGASESPSQFKVDVTWGDGSSSRSDDGSGDVTVISNGDGTFNVIGRHTYPGEAGTTYGGFFPSGGIAGASVFVTSTDESALTTLPATLEEAGPLTNVSAHSFSEATGQTLINEVVATFSDPGGPAGADADTSEYQASINWGDGTANDTNVIIWPNGNGNYSVLGTNHTYSSASTGPFQVSVTITHDGTSNVVVGQAFVTVPTTFTVTSLLDDGSVGTLRWAVGQANSTMGLATINFAPALFATPQTIHLSGTPLELSNTNATETIVGPAAGVTVTGDGRSRVFQADAGASASLSGLTITGGMTAGGGGGLDNEGGITTLIHCSVSGNSASKNGGGLFDNRGVTTLTDCIVSGNSSGNNGGGLYDNSILTLTNCEVSGNSAGNHGGGVYDNSPITLTNCAVSGNTAGNNGGGLYENSIVTLTNCTVSGNNASTGGGLLNRHGTFTLINCTVSGNSASNNGGGLDNFGTATLTNCTVSSNNAGSGGGGLDNFGTATLTNCTVSGNSARGRNVGGGGLLNRYRSILSLTNCTVSGNYASRFGGGLNNFGTATLTNCTVSGNSASRLGGGLDNRNTATLTNCTVSGNSAGISGGGLNNFGTATLTNCTVSGNSASYGGGLNTYGTSTLTNCTVSGNSAGFGGGLDNIFGHATLTNCTVSGNSAGIAGGGLDNYYGDAALTNCTISGNSATYGGGLRNIYNSAVTLTNCTVSGNSASFDGGGVFSALNGTTALTDCTVSGNAARYGGGLLSNAPLALNNCTVSGNSASRNGGGVYVNFGMAALTNCTVSGNTAANYGGGLNFYAGSAALTNCTVSGNTAANGGAGLYSFNNYRSVFGPLTLTNAIVAGNTNTSSAASDISGSAMGANNLIGVGGSGGLVNGVFGNLVGVTNALLAPLGNYGGPTQTMPLLPGSLAIDAGISIGAPAFDQRGQGRVGAVDIGAFESQGFTVAVTSGSDQSTNISTAFAAPLVVTVTANNPGEPVAGGLVTFTSPASGASAAIGGSPAIISAAGTASVTATANGFAGSYTVSATASGIAIPASFNLSNLPTITEPAAQTAYQNVDLPISGLLIGDDTSATLTVTLNVRHGTLVLATTTGLTMIAGNGSGAVTLTGTTANLNAALATLVYRGNLNYSGGDTLNLMATGSGVSATPASAAITVESIAQQATNLQARVSAFQTAGALNQGQANSLIVKLNLVGNNGDIGKVQAFLIEVTADLQAGILTQAQADALLGPGNVLLLGVTRR
jgi:hypothetical protein